MSLKTRLRYLKWVIFGRPTLPPKEPLYGTSRKLVRKQKGTRKSSLIGKFAPLEPFSSGRTALPDGFRPHNGGDPLGQWQIEYLNQHGLEPHHVVLDIGCGDLRGGVPLIRFLDPGNYVGVEQTESALAQGMHSLTPHEMEAKQPTFYIGANFGFEAINRQFDYLWAHSVFTHIDLSFVSKCMASAFHVLKPNGKFIASYFVGKQWIEPQTYAREYGDPDNEKYTYSYRNPYHHQPAVLKFIAEQIGYEVAFLEGENVKGQRFIQMRKPG